MLTTLTAVRDRADRIISNRDDSLQRAQDETLPKWKTALVETFRSSGRGSGSLRKSPSAVQLHKARTKEASRASKARATLSPSPSTPSQGLTTVPENQSSASVAILGSPSPLSKPDIERLAFSSSEANLLARTPAELAQAVLRLRSMQDKIPSRTSSDLRDKHVEPPIISKRRWTQQQDELMSARETIARLESELQEEKIRYAEAEKARKQAVHAQALLTRTEPNIFDDEHFREQVENLQFKVGHWVRNQEWKILGYRSQREAQEKFGFLGHTCPQYPDYFTSKRGMELLVEAHVWQFLGTEIFERDVWAMAEEEHALSPQSDSVNPFAEWKKYLGLDNPRIIHRRQKLRCSIEQSINEDQKELLHAWRVASARLMAARKSPAVYTAVMNATQDLVLDFEEELKPLAVGVLDLGRLELLCREAVQLDSIIQQQRPFYHFYPIFRSRMGKWPFMPSCMEVFGDNGKNPVPKEAQVKLVLRPSFRKYGNSAGKNYKQEISILNMIVDIKGK
jgi:hypothetical protein